MTDFRPANHLGPQATCTCQDCGKTWKIDDTNPIADPSERLAVGEEIPAGECPECGCCCAVDNGFLIATSNKILAQIDLAERLADTFSDPNAPVNGADLVDFIASFIERRGLSKAPTTAPGDHTGQPLRPHLDR